MDASKIPLAGSDPEDVKTHKLFIFVFHTEVKDQKFRITKSREFTKYVFSTSANRDSVCTSDNTRLSRFITDMYYHGFDFVPLP